LILVVVAALSLAAVADASFGSMTTTTMTATHGVANQTYVEALFVLSNRGTLPPLVLVDVEWAAAN
jgi:hypothetical protein